MYEELLIGLRGHARRKGCDDRCPCYDAVRRGYSTCSEELAEKAADAIEELVGKVEQLPRWIPVTERLPDYPGRLMCYYEVNDYGEIGHCIDWGRYDPDDGWYVGGVTHWMPLPPAPEPPKEEA